MDRVAAMQLECVWRLCLGFALATSTAGATVKQAAADAEILASIEQYLNSMQSLSCRFIQFESCLRYEQDAHKGDVRGWQKAEASFQRSLAKDNTENPAIEEGQLYMLRSGKAQYKLRMDLPCAPNTRRRILVKNNLMWEFDLQSNKQIAKVNLMSTPVAHLFSGAFSFSPRFHTPELMWLDQQQTLAVKVDPKTANTPSVVLFFAMEGHAAQRLLGWQVLSLRGPPVSVCLEAKSFVINKPETLPHKCFEQSLGAPPASAHP